MLRPAVIAVLFFVLVPSTVHAFDHHHHGRHSSSHHGGGCGGPSSSTPSTDPSEGASVTAPTSTSTPAKRVFVTSTTVSGAIGGVIAADAHCQARAHEAGLVGSFRAWISDEAIDAIEHVSGSGPWSSISNALAFAGRSALHDGPATALLDERGQAIAATARIWSGSDSDGLATHDDCAGWTNATAQKSATTGTALQGDPGWGGGDAPLACNDVARLLCFQE